MPTEIKNRFNDSTSIHYNSIPAPKIENLKPHPDSSFLSTTSTQAGSVQFSYAYLKPSNEQTTKIHFNNLNSYNQQTIVVKQDNFKSGEYELNDEQKKQLQEYANKINEYFKNNPNGTLNISGFTDRDGSAQENIALSGKRAQEVEKFLKNYVDEKYHSRIQTTANGEKYANQSKTLTTDRKVSVDFFEPTSQRYGVLVLDDNASNIKGEVIVDMGHGRLDKTKDPNYNPNLPEGSTAVVLSKDFVQNSKKPLYLNFQVENPNNVRFLAQGDEKTKFDIMPVEGKPNTFSLSVNGKNVATIHYDLVGNSEGKEVKLADVNAGKLHNNGSVHMQTQQDIFSNVMAQKDKVTNSEIVSANAGFVAKERVVSPNR